MEHFFEEVTIGVYEELPEHERQYEDAFPDKKMGEKHKLVILTGARCKCAEYIN